MNTTSLLLVCLSLVISPLSAQENLYTLTPVPLQDLSGFRPAAKNWQVVGQVAGGFADASLATTSGSGVLANLFSPEFQYKPEANLFSQFEHGDLYLELDFMVPKGSNSGIYLQSRYEIQLFDSWNVNKLAVQDCGSIYERWDERRPEGKKGFEGRPARVNAALAPGLWQHLVVLFQAPKFDKAGKKTENARFVKVVLNGVVIHENVAVSGPTRAAVAEDEKPLAPLMIQGDHGQVFFRNLKYGLLGELDLQLNGLNYEYYETTQRDFTKITAKELVRKGATEALDYRLADLSDKFSLKFAGKLDAPTTDTYTFTAYLSGNYQLQIDGKVVSPQESWTYLYGSPAKLQVPLTAGGHDFVFQFTKQDSWAPTGLALFVQKPNTKPVPLHAPSSLPELPQPGLIELSAEREPTLLRSFLLFDQQKKTHCLSVGDPAGVHYSYDLDQASVLYVWKGKFLNLNDMWFERGEPQTAQPLGANLRLTGKSPLALVNSADDPLPDTLDAQTLVYQGYVLDEKRYPTFHYAYGGSTIQDHLLPLANAKGLARSLKTSNIPANKKLVFRLAEGASIREISKNFFAINNQQYFLQITENQNLKLTIKTLNGQQVLLAESPNGELKYDLVW